MSSLLLLTLLPHAAPPPVLRPREVVVAGGLIFVKMPVPDDMHWPEVRAVKGWGRQTLEEAARPQLIGPGVRFEWVEDGLKESPSLEFIGRLEGKAPDRLRLKYQACRPGMNALHGAEVSLAGVETHKGARAELAAREKEAALGRLVSDEVLSGGLSYFASAREALAREWKVRQPEGRWWESPGRPVGLYELTAGAESLENALSLSRTGRADHLLARRTVPVGKIQGVKIADHPWDKMRDGKKPRPEPLAEAVPHDNWYLTVRKLDALAELAEFLEGWGSPLRWAVPSGRDHRLLERYQGQLCLPIKELAKSVPAKLVRGVALTGSDLFWVEGTDVTVIVDTPGPRALTAILNKHATGKVERLTRKGGPDIERRGSQFRAVVGERVVISNCLPALNSVLDTIAGRRRSLAKSPDFRYMRTAFVNDEKQEDGFAFLSDDFIRALAGPALRVKAMRRLSSRAALVRAGNAALTFASVEHRWPDAPDEFARFGLQGGKPIVDAEGDCILWSPARGEASSKTYGTLASGTPLIEIAIKGVTPEERDAYLAFRHGYEQAWRAYIDPVGIRMKRGDVGVRAEAYMLPLTSNSHYSLLRLWSRGNATTWCPLPLAPSAVLQFRMAYQHERSGLAVQLDDSPSLRKWGQAVVAANLYPEKKLGDKLRLPLVFLFGGKHGKNVRGFVDLSMSRLEPSLFTGKPTERKHNGVWIYREPLSEAALESKNWPHQLIRILAPGPSPAMYEATISQTGHIAFQSRALEQRIDASKKGAREIGEPAAASLYLTRKHPGMSAAIEWLLERQVRQQAHAANVMWQALYEAGIVTPKMSEARRRKVALRLWGFVPAAPDGSRAVWHAGTRQVRNERHGTWQNPASHLSPDPKSQLLKFLRRFESMRADLRFREDGIHTVVTFGFVK